MTKSLILFCAVFFAFSAMSVRAQSSDALSSEPAKPGAESLELLEKGNSAFINREFAAAIPSYEKALDIEKKSRTLERERWIELINNLSIAHAMSGDVKSSRSVTEYGISKEPTYPLFYYNNASGYALENDELNAIKYLRLAFKYKDNMLEKEPLPDPATDSSFEALMKSEKFKMALAEMKAAK